MDKMNLAKLCVILSEDLKLINFECKDIERTGDATPLNIQINKLIAFRQHLDYFTDCSFFLVISKLKKILNDANIDEVTLDNYKPEESKCKYNQDVLKAVRKELEETRNTISSSISDLAFLQDEIENIYNLVNDGCID